jgi:hypothetical protein
MTAAARRLQGHPHAPEIADREIAFALQEVDSRAIAGIDPVGDEDLCAGRRQGYRLPGSSFRLVNEGRPDPTRCMRGMDVDLHFVACDLASLHKAVASQVAIGGDDDPGIARQIQPPPEVQEILEAAVARLPKLRHLHTVTSACTWGASVGVGCRRT